MLRIITKKRGLFNSKSDGIHNIRANPFSKVDKKEAVCYNEHTAP